MHFEAHAALGWAIGVFAPGSDRRIRACALVAAIAPDLDAVIPYMIGPEAYSNYHHTFGHNLFVGFGLAAVCGLVVRRKQETKVKAITAAVTLVAFLSHFFTDSYFTRFPVYPFWPLSKYTLLVPSPHGWGLASPINTYLAYASYPVVVILAGWKRVSPLELISPRLDRIVQNAFRKRDQSCATCQASCNNRCDACETPTCMKHAGLHGWFRIRCHGCSERPGTDAK